MYLVTRADLTPGQQIAQTIHGYREFIQRYPEIDQEWHKTSNYVCVLEVPNEDALVDLLSEALERQIKVASFQEPDLANQLTCICLEPSDASKRLTGSLRLAGKGR